MHEPECLAAKIGRDLRHEMAIHLPKRLGYFSHTDRHLREWGLPGTSTIA